MYVTITVFFIWNVQ